MWSVSTELGSTKRINAPYLRGNQLSSHLSSISIPPHCAQAQQLDSLYYFREFLQPNSNYYSKQEQNRPKMYVFCLIMAISAVFPGSASSQSTDSLPSPHAVNDTRTNLCSECPQRLKVELPILELTLRTGKSMTSQRSMETSGGAIPSRLRSSRETLREQQMPCWKPHRIPPLHTKRRTESLFPRRQYGI